MTLLTNCPLAIIVAVICARKPARGLSLFSFTSTVRIKLKANAIEWRPSHHPEVVLQYSWVVFFISIIALRIQVCYHHLSHNTIITVESGRVASYRIAASVYIRARSHHRVREYNVCVYVRLSLSGSESFV